MSGMVGRVYRWRGELWRVRCRWAGTRAPRNVLLERVVPVEVGNVYAGRPYLATGEFVVRPFRGLRKL